MCTLLQQAALACVEPPAPPGAGTVLAGALHVLQSVAMHAMRSQQYNALVDGAPPPCSAARAARLLRSALLRALGAFEVPVQGCKGSCDRGEGVCGWL